MGSRTLQCLGHLVKERVGLKAQAEHRDAEVDAPVDGKIVVA